MVDRFHFKSHTCSEIHDPDSYFWMDVDRTTTAESLNARLGKSVPYLRFVKEDNLIPHLNIRFALLNITTRYRRKHKTDDMEDEDVWEFFKETVPCACESCFPDAVTAINLRDESDYVAPVMEQPDAVTTTPQHGAPHDDLPSPSTEEDDVVVASDAVRIDDDIQS